jgi:hypothetical protein
VGEKERLWLGTVLRKPTQLHVSTWEPSQTTNGTYNDIRGDPSQLCFVFFFVAILYRNSANGGASGM